LPRRHRASPPRSGGSVTACPGAFALLRLAWNWQSVGRTFGSRKARNLAKDTKPPTSSTGSRWEIGWSVVRVPCCVVRVPWGHVSHLTHRVKYGRPASAARVPCVGTAGDGMHRKQSPSTEPWCDCGMDGPLRRGGFLVWERRAMGCIESGAHPQSGGVHAVWTARFSGEGFLRGNGGRWGASKAQPVHNAVARSGMDGLLQRGGFLVWKRRAMGCTESAARPQSRGAHAVWTACFSGEGSSCGNGGR